MRKQRARLSVIGLTLTLTILSLVSPVADVRADDEAVERPTVELWPGTPPGEDPEKMKEERLVTRSGGGQIARLTDVYNPSFTVYLPPAEKQNGTAVVICPGGGYSILAIEHEGTMVAEWLNSLGVTAVVLKYRVPRRPDLPKHLAPLQDAQRTMSLVRSNAAKWGIDPKRIGILGFSAGGHLSVTTSTNADRRAYEAIDEADKESCRPDFAVLIYPAYAVADGKLAEEIRLSKETTPPTFIAVGGKDPWTPSSVALFAEMRKAGVPVELHCWSEGGHGFGMKRNEEEPCTKWPDRCEEWLERSGLLE